MFSGPIRGGTRGGQGDFKWTDVADDKDRENYLGHSILAPVGRWQKNRDITWYNHNKNQNLTEDQQQAENLRRKQEEIRAVKAAEEEALSLALGFKPAPKGVGSSSNATALGDRPGASTSAAEDSEAKAARRAAEKAEKAARKAARAAKRAAKRGKSPSPRRRYDDHGQRARSRSEELDRYRSGRAHGRSRSRSVEKDRAIKGSRVRSRSRSVEPDRYQNREGKRRDMGHHRSRSPLGVPRRRYSPSPERSRRRPSPSVNDRHYPIDSRSRR